MPIAKQDAGMWLSCLRFSTVVFELKAHNTWIEDCLFTGKPSQYITIPKINSAFHPSGVGKLSTSLSG